MGVFGFLRELFGGGSEDEPSRADASESGGGGDESVKDVTEFRPAEFRREAEEFAADHEDREFDFTIESLERLDEYAVSQTELLAVLDDEMDESAELTGGAREGFILWFGSYFGEVLVRQFDGEWVTDGDGVHVAVPVGDGVAEIPPLDAGAIAVEGDPQFAAMAAELQTEIDRAERGAEPDPSVGADGDAVQADPSVPTVDLEPGMDLDAAHERAVEAFDEAGFYVTEGTVMNSVEGPLQGIAKLFNFHDDAGMYVGVVYTGEWDDEVTNGVLSLASTVRPDPADGVFVVSATEPPAGAEYLTGTGPRGAFVLEAMHEVQNGPAFTADSAEHYAEAGRELLAAYFDLQVDVDDLDALEALDEFVLSELRTVDDHERSQEGYVPHEALVLVGTLAGEVMRRALEGDHGASTVWTDDESVSSTGVALTVTDEGGDSMTVNPVGKAFKLFESGSSDSIAFMYQTTVGVLQNEL
ncbi:hypothetical protein ACFQL4_16370 [Halosimplex aquaticum]